ncbi:MAG: ATP-binding cassette domain-containing protein [Candidatus Symbiodolus clandestinus]
MQSKPLLSCHQLSHCYQQGDQSVSVLQAINLELKASEQVALLGSSGSGKSTLLQLLGGLQRPSAGKIFFQQQPLHQLSMTAKAQLRNRSLGFIYQFHHLLPDFNAWENVAMPLLIAGVKRSVAREQAYGLLEQIGLLDRLHHRPSALSGGERQRVAVARALINRPALVLADEPTGALDRQNAQCLIELMQRFNRQLGTAFLVATHDSVLAAQLQRQWQLVDGRLQLTEQ